MADLSKPWHRLAREVMDHYDSPGFTESVATRVRDLRAMLYALLGTDYDKTKMHAVLKSYEEFYQSQDSLDEAYDQGLLKAEVYLHNSNLAFQQALDHCESVLGPVDFSRVFDDAAKGAAYHMADHDEFFRQHQKRR